MIYYVSDMFFGNEYIAKRRHFSSVDDMNNLIVSNWNKVVCSDDTVYILGGVGDFNFLNSLSGEKILVMSDHEEDHFLSYVNGISPNRNKEYDYEMYEWHLVDIYGIKSLVMSKRIVKKNYAGRTIRLATEYSVTRDTIPSIIGGVNEYQRLFKGGLNSNIFVNGYYPISDVEAEELLRKMKDIL